LTPKKILFLGLTLSLVILVAICLFNAFRLSSKQIKEYSAKHLILDKSCEDRLSKAIQFKTISPANNELIDTTEFLAFHNFLKEAFPLVDKNLKLEKINKLSLLYQWEGTDKNLPPLLLMAHQDVVPIDSTGSKKWTFGPFTGTKSKGYIYGRGTLDVKSSLLGQLEAIEFLIKQGYLPKRTIYLAYGHDEEAGGHEGAKKIVDYLLKRGKKLDFVLDEGGSIISEIVPGLTKPIALVGIAEKGYLSLELKVDDDGGHSSMPPKETAIGILSSALSKLEAKPFPYKIGGAGTQMFDYLAPEMNFLSRLIFGNTLLFSPLIKWKLGQNNATRAILHTTTAVTSFSSGEKENVLPTSARCVINFRIIPGESMSSVQNYVTNIINDKRIKITKASNFCFEPSVVSSTNSEQFIVLNKTISSLFPDVLVAPFLAVGSTDSRHYQALTKNIYRFVPIRFTKEDLPRVHGTNERISVKSFHESINFYIRFLKKSSSK
jgi:carboxypeptidase PM20D1